MPTCETCGNTYDDVLEISYRGESHVFDSFECAIEALAPRCSTCECRIIGHGVEANGRYYCCEHCAKKAGDR